MDKLLKKIKDNILEKKLINSGDKVLIAWSGGPDSTALLSILKNLRDDLDFHIEAFYFNHDSREDSSQEEAFVELFSQKHLIKLHTSKSRKKTIGQGPEDTWRKERYSVIEKIIQKDKFDKVATGHTLDDNLETLLIRLGRGSGLEGIKGIPIRRDYFIRPLLNVTKKDLMTYLEKNELQWYKDPSNENNLIRASLRKEVIPALKKTWDRYWPAGPEKRLSILAEENQSLNVLSNDLLRIYLNEKGLNREVFNLPPAISLRVIKNWLYSIGVNPPGGALERVLNEGRSKKKTFIEGPSWFRIEITNDNIVYVGD